MNNVFCFKRFGRYLLWDIRQAWNNSGIAVLILGLMPVIYFIFDLLFSRVFGTDPEPMNTSGMSYGLLTAVFIISTMLLPARTYGRLTEKGYGSSWLLIPASTLEKFISMLLLLCVIMPVCVLVLFLASDWLLSHAFHSIYGKAFDMDMLTLATFHDEEGMSDITINMPALVFFSFVVNTLFFTLGAIFFKKAKVGKSILVAMAFSMFLSLAFSVPAGKLGVSILQDPERFDIATTFEGLNTALSVILGVQLLLFGTCIYFRLKKMQI